MYFLFGDYFHEVRSHGLAGYRTFHLARPAGDLDADFRILAQAQDHALRALAGAENVDALDQNWQLDQPGEAEPPSEQGDSEDEQADRRRTAPQQVNRPDGSQHPQEEAPHAGNHEQAKEKLSLGVEARRVVQVEPVRTQ